MRAALVTGAASGIGRAICERLVDDGWSVLAVDLTPDPAGTGEPFAADLTTAAGNEAAVAAALERFGKLDALVAGSGGGAWLQPRPFPWSLSAAVEDRGGGGGSRRRS